VLGGYPKVAVLAFSPNGSLLACGYNNRMLKLWEISSEYIDNHPSHRDSVIALAFLQDEEIIVSALYDKTIRLRDIRQARDIF
jgi:WD40 repeat protein